MDEQATPPLEGSAQHKNSEFPEVFPYLMHIDPLGAQLQLTIETPKLIQLVERLRNCNMQTDEGLANAARLVGAFYTAAQPTFTLRPYIRPEKSPIIRPGHELADVGKLMDRRR